MRRDMDDIAELRDLIEHWVVRRDEPLRIYREGDKP